MRAGLSWIIEQLRRSTETVASSDDPTSVKDVFTDDELQEILDTYRKDVVEIQLAPVPERNNTGWKYVKYFFPSSVPIYVESPLTEGAFKLITYSGELIDPSEYTYVSGERYVEFASDRSGLAVFMTARSFNFRYAIARVWFEKAAKRAALIDWKANGLSMAEDQEYAHCMQLCKAILGTADTNVLFNGSGVTSTIQFKGRDYDATNRQSEYFTPKTNDSPASAIT